MKCRHCGKEYEDSFSYCPYCAEPKPLKKLYSLTIIIFILLTLGGCEFTLKSNSNGMSVFDQSTKTERKLSPGEVFEKNTYIDIAGVRLLYDGDMFLIQNNNAHPVRLTYTIVGVKKDGTFDKISMSALSGVDKSQYEKDLAENGWAVEQYTNLVRQNTTLEADLGLSDYLLYDNADIPTADIDNDGYIDVFFTVSPQQDDEQIITSSDDPVTDIYKIKVE